MSDDAAIVVGAGVAGLIAARHLRRAGASVTVLEAARHPGGRARTEEWAGCRIELGAVYLTSHYRELMRAARELGVDSELTPLPNAFRATVWRSGRWHDVDYARPFDGAQFGAVSVRDKLSLALLWRHLLHAPGMRFGDLATAAALDTRTLAEAVRPDAARYFVSPVIELFCGYRPEEVTLPVVAMALRYGGRARSVRGGIGTLTAALANEAEVRCGVRVTGVAADPGGGAVVQAIDGRGRDESHRARAVVIATPADQAARIWSDAPAGARAFLDSTRYADGFSVWLRTRRPARELTRGRQDLYMRLLPAGERAGALHAIGFVDSAAPDGGLVRVEATAAARAAHDDDTLAAKLEAELGELEPEIAADVVDRRIARAPRVVAAYPVGRVRELRRFRATQGPGPVQLAGDYLYGPWMESAALSGRVAGERAAGTLSVTASAAA